jgi:hypothetical protein
MKEMIAEKLNQRLKSEVVQTIFFMVGRIEAPALEPQLEEPKSETGVASRQVNEEFLQSIEDPEIREAFRKLLKSFKQRKSKG